LQSWEENWMDTLSGEENGVVFRGEHVFGGLEKNGYAAIVCDPPWRYATWSQKGRGRCPDFQMPRAMQRQNRPERHYQTMPMDQLEALPVADLAAKHCALFLWAIDPMLPQAIALGQRWGFTYKTVGFYWGKLRREGSTRHLLHEEPDHKLFPMGTGYWSRPNPEQCLLFTRGKPKRLSAAVRKLIIAPRREHSRKPDETYERVEQLCSGPYLDLFSRRSRPGWTCWGDQSGLLDSAAWAASMQIKPGLPSLGSFGAAIITGRRL
jgi:N6-adenosine-specific RNA methylase IME4